MLRSRQAKTIAALSTLAVGLTATVGGYFVLEMVRVGVQQRLANRLGRPVKLTGVRGISHRGLHWGRAQIPLIQKHQAQRQPSPSDSQPLRRSHA